MDLQQFLGPKLKTNASVRRLLAQKGIQVNGVLVNSNISLSPGDRVRVGRKREYIVKSDQKILIEALEARCIHPAAHDRMVPIELIHKYRGRLVAFGQTDQTGWYVLEKDSEGKTGIAWTERTLQGVRFSVADHCHSEVFVAHTEAFDDDAYIYSRASLGALLSATDTEPLKNLPMGKETNISGPSGASFCIKRIDSNLYQLTSQKNIS